MFVSRILFLIVLAFSFLRAQNSPEPFNIILLIGDGMGLNYVSLSNLFLENDPYENFTTVGLINTTAVDNTITDSAAGATAFATGFKTKNGRIGVDENGNPLTSVFEVAKSNYMKTGFVVTSSVTHATPGSFYANVVSRSMHTQIADQLLTADIDVVIGGGRGFFKPLESGGFRTDGVDLFTGFTGSGYSCFTSEEDLFSDTTSGQHKLLALLEDDGLKKAAERNYSLGSLVELALKNLKNSQNGFILMVEGSQIDWAGHANNQDDVIKELYDFNSAINAAFKFAESNKNTLIIVTADHETGGMAINSVSDDNTDFKLGFTSLKHTAGLIPVFAFGPQSEQFGGIYDNSALGQKLIKLIDSSIPFE